jgi:hypothetical protein
MLRRVFSIVAALSLLLCIASAVLWIATPHLSRKTRTLHTGAHLWTLHTSGTYFGLEVQGGTLLPGGGFRAPKGQHWDTSWANPTHRLPLGFAYGINPPNDPTAAPYFHIVGPWYWPVIFTAVLPLIWLAMFVRDRRKRRREQQLHLCPKCGYDLRATPTGCPECGTSVAT